jgi:hypothetical protein
MSLAHRFEARAAGSTVSLPKIPLEIGRRLRTTVWLASVRILRIASSPDREHHWSGTWHAVRGASVSCPKA